MAFIYRLTDGTNTVDFNGSSMPSTPGSYKEVRHDALGGTQYVYQYYRRYRREIDIERLPKAKADQLNAWRQANTTLTFYPDLINHPTETVTVRIVSSADPLATMDGQQWDQLYKGTLPLEAA